MTAPLQVRMRELGKRLFTLKRRKAKLVEELKKLDEEIDHIATQDLATMMIDSEIEKFTIKGHGTLYMKDVFYCNVLAENRERLHNWLRDTGQDALITEYVQPSTLKAFAKEELSQGRPLPDFINTQMVPTASTLTRT